MGSVADSSVIQLYRFCQQLAEDALQLAKDGEKDTARDVYRFLLNSCAVAVVRDHSEEDWSLLQWKIGELGRMCSPLPGDRYAQFRFRRTKTGPCSQATADVLRPVGGL